MPADATTRTEAPNPRGDYDSPWKDLLDRWLRDFLTFFFAEAAADIDWSRGHEFLDKELQKLTRKAKRGRRSADKLIKVWRRGGEETWVLVHIEVQGDAQTVFAERMFTYNTRLRDRYARPVASFAVLTDGNRRWRPRRYEQRLWGCRVLLEFPTVKLVDYRDRLAALEADANPFAMVVLAQLAALATRRAPEARLEQKLGLTRRLLERGWAREDVLSLYAFIDWVLALPEALEAEYHQRVTEIEEARHVKYVTTAERIGMRKGMQLGFEQGIEQGIEQGVSLGESKILLRQMARRFSPLPDWVEQRLAQATPMQLEAWADRLFDACSLDELFDDQP